MINYVALLEVISKYKRDIKKHWELERYKWVAIKQFQDHWNIEAENFAEMYKESISKTYNLLNSSMNFPGAQIYDFAKENPEKTREMFLLLFDESQDVYIRIAKFKEMGKEILNHHNEVYPDAIWKTYYQTDNAVTTYLWLRFPDKYFIYKYSEYIITEQVLCGSHNIKKGIGLKPGYAMYYKIREYLLADEELKSIWSELIDKDCYSDPELITATVDFGFYISRYCKPTEEQSARYWVINHKYSNASAQEMLALREGALRSNSAYMQEEYGHQSGAAVTMNWKLAVQVKRGDYIFLRNGDRVYAVGQAIAPRKEHNIELNAQSIISNNNNYPYLSGSYTGVIVFEDAEVFYEDLTDGTANNWGQRFDVDAWQYYTPYGVPPIKKYVDSYERNTIREISKEDGEQLIKELKLQLGMKYEILNQLEQCRNLILTGAPGTGKTYLAKQIARLMLFGKADEAELNVTEQEIYKNHVEFVQFHPSYDYSDFVEGLRPVQTNDGGSMGFERVDGVFKNFCKRAVLNAEYESENFDESWGAMIADISDHDYLEIPLISGKGTFRIELNEYETGLTSRTYPNNVYEKDQWIVGKSKFFSKEQLLNIYHGLNGVPAGGHDNYRRAIVEYMKEHYGLKAYEAKQARTYPYIIIIDEINRGEISKIFGELFYAIDPGYRGESGRVKTQYQNLIPDDDTFSNGFYVPENVYVLGTMNDIDRSVESMDFAIRRRFTWREIAAQDTQNDILALLPDSIRDEAKVRMDSLNNAILEPEYHLGEAYQIGASYFLKLRYDQSFENLWKFHLKGLLYEYLRGQRDIDNKLAALHKAYMLE